MNQPIVQFPNNDKQPTPTQPKSRGEKVGNAFLWIFFSALIYWIGFMFVTAWREAAMENPGPGGSIGSAGAITSSDLLLIVGYLGWIFVVPVIALIVFIVKLIKAVKKS